LIQVTITGGNGPVGVSGILKKGFTCLLANGINLEEGFLATAQQYYTIPYADKLFICI